MTIRERTMNILQYKDADRLPAVRFVTEWTIGDIYSAHQTVPIRDCHLNDTNLWTASGMKKEYIDNAKPFQWLIQWSGIFYSFASLYVTYSAKHFSDASVEMNMDYKSVSGDSYWSNKNGGIKPRPTV